MKQPNGKLTDSMVWLNLSSLIAPVAYTNTNSYSRQLIVFFTFVRTSTTPFTTSLSQTGETWSKLVEATKVFNGTVMYTSVWLRETNNDAYTVINVSYDGPQPFIAVYRRFLLATPSTASLYKPLQAMSSTSQGLVTYTPDLTSVASGTFTRLDFLFNARYADPVVQGYVSDPDVSYGDSSITYRESGSFNATYVVGSQAPYWSGMVEIVHVSPSAPLASPSTTPGWVPVPAGPIPYTNLCQNPNSNPPTYTQRYTETMAVSVMVPSHNYSQVM